MYRCRDQSWGLRGKQEGHPRSSKWGTHVSSHITVNPNESTHLNVRHPEGIGVEGGSCLSDRCDKRWGVARDGDVSDAGASEGVELG